MQAPLPGVAHQRPIRVPLRLAPAHQRSRLQVPTLGRAAPPSRLLVVQRRKERAVRDPPRRRVVLQRGPQRLDHRVLHALPDFRRQSRPPPHEAGEERELLFREERPAPDRDAGRLRPRDLSSAPVPHHDAVGGQVPQPLGPTPQHHARAAHDPRQPGLKVHDAQQVADHRAPRRQRLPARVEHPQAHQPLARRATVPVRLEKDEVAPLHDEDAHDGQRPQRRPPVLGQDGPSHVSHQQQGRQHHGRQDDGHDRQVRRHRREARAQVGQVVTQPNVLRRLQSHAPGQRLPNANTSFASLARQRVPQNPLHAPELVDGRDPTAEKTPVMPEEGLEPPTRGL